MNTKSLVAGIIGALLLGGLFIGATLLVETFQEDIERLVYIQGGLGMSMYVIITISSVVIAPASSLPLMPLAVGLWGWVATALLSIMGWVIGSQIAFWLARRYGRTLLERFVSLSKLYSYENNFNKRDIFWSVVFLRMTVPVDILSYALGLFSSMSAPAYFIATLIGVTPFAFIFAYTGSLPPGLQFIILAGVVLFVFIIHRLRRRLRNNE